MKSGTFWHPGRFMEKRAFIEKRAALLRRLRAFFDGLGYVEVDTPALQVSPGLEPHLHAFKTELVSADRQEIKTMYLHTSPEFAMKKLLVAGMPRIYQLCKTFRNAEGSKLHSPEFTMLEWYHAGIGYRELMNECVGLLRACADSYENGDIVSDPDADWEIITVCEAFRKYAGIDLEACLGDLAAFEQAATDTGVPPHDGDAWDDVFFRVFLEKIEPELGHPAPTIIYDYPVHMAALSRAKPDDPRFAERFEIYLCGVELANAFAELTDAKEQRRRFEADMDLKEKLYGERYPIDEDFLAALEHGMPEASGIALGIDRLVMLATGASHIHDVLAIPVDDLS